MLWTAEQELNSNQYLWITVPYYSSDQLPSSIILLLQRKVYEIELLMGKQKDLIHKPVRGESDIFRSGDCWKTTLFNGSWREPLYATHDPMIQKTFRTMQSTGKTVPTFRHVFVCIQTTLKIGANTVCRSCVFFGDIFLQTWSHLYKVLHRLKSMERWSCESNYHHL